MRAQIKLGRIFGVEIGLHYSWFLIALLITFSLAGHFQANNPGWSDGLRWGVSIVTALLFFASIVVHELIANDSVRVEVWLEHLTSSRHSRPTGFMLTQ